MASVSSMKVDPLDELTRGEKNHFHEGDELIDDVLDSIIGTKVLHDSP